MLYWRPKCLALEKTLDVKIPCKNQDLLLESMRKWLPCAYEYGYEGYANFLHLPNLLRRA